MSKFKLPIIALTLLISFSATCTALEVPYIDIGNAALVGTIPPGCKEVLDNGTPAKTPAGFRLSPQEALATAKKAVELDCSGDASRYVLAYEKRYSVFSLNLLPSGAMDSSTALIDGVSGEVIKTRKQRFDGAPPASGVSAAQPGGKR